ncbi:aminomethyl-transferring glycine dehydrogenase [Bordetella avium]|uniref:Glycine dehydrogenase (decarboxylating) n=3 Tax=Bordetella avium TaxID=521 RepID=GCSP_BORA1|nr:aminomethyl-transferring glycine dehydrogenase [Bordetella avium]Q2KYL7.1 RecName: Full=Glycine dehydrogenase (decarboxylating); AltName: Full=Glycine cleavage system P-protein; AltName: Full=Glycine decarboxylase; AltName: Full=Glycine dehydrogenase (aminomethyl-transferring) [Bordetella avium 197N]AZY51443.1 glycine dehydrogenase [Bordetella avium]RIQ16813.1 glycine dehydrogenase (aminomethyl-transferring) [Bordetella avium]RIQ35147.1 glycine dehydrogenase (aminomethyl-transferring) [Borde
MSRALDTHSDFIPRHIGPSEADQAKMLATIGCSSLDALLEEVVPPRIRNQAPLALPGARSEPDVLAELKQMAARNKVFRNYIGQGYYGTHTPNVVLRNVLENPAWYTAYTPYQPEISQGRLEALLNYQTMVADLTGLDISNASLLDEGTAAAEAMTLARRSAKSKSAVFFVSQHCHPQTIEVVRTRAQGLDIDVLVGDESQGLPECFGVLLQYPHSLGGVVNYRELAEAAHAQGAVVACATDLLALALLTPPGEWGADIAVGTAQRFGVPFGFGGPHAGFMACRDAFKRNMPGRLVGVSKDAQGNPALRLALQTREQHIRREKATSNICTAQVLLAVMAGLYAVWHGPAGLRRIATRVHTFAGVLRQHVQALGLTVENDSYFDTLLINTGPATPAVLRAAECAHINLRRVDAGRVAVSIDETVTVEDLQALINVFAAGLGKDDITLDAATLAPEAGLPAGTVRTSPILSHPVFSSVQSETDMLRYLRKLADKDLALDRSMIPLGSCTMKLNATAEMIPITWPEFALIHPFAPADQTAGYRELIERLSAALCEITGYDNISLQPNSGAQGEYAGLLAIRGYHQARGEHQRNICLIPSSAHGTNPASAQLAGMDVVVVASDDHGNVDLDDLRAKIEQVGDRLAALMITYPSTHGVFEETVTEICERVHAAGGQVYLDGANMNAMVGVAKPGKFGSDVSHLNLHKTFCIPHGGGGPGVGPVAVRAHLAPYLPGVLNEQGKLDAEAKVGPVSAAPYGSAGILAIPFVYISLMGAEGLRRATEVAILNANYVATRLREYYPVLYAGRHGRVAHECILDIRPLKESIGISAEDIAKRLMDYGFHAPTMSFPVAGTLMVEPTESEGLAELERFIDAMIAIRAEVAQVERGERDREDNVLKNAPHTAQMLLAEEWHHAYPRQQAAYPLASLRDGKYWPPVARVDNAYGDRNLVCSCLPIEAYI